MVYPNSEQEQTQFIYDFETILNEETLDRSEEEDYSLESLFTTFNSRLLDEEIIPPDLKNYDEIEKFIEELITNPAFLD